MTDLLHSFDTGDLEISAVAVDGIPAEVSAYIEMSSETSIIEEYTELAVWYVVPPGYETSYHGISVARRVTRMQRSGRNRSRRDHLQDRSR